MFDKFKHKVNGFKYFRKKMIMLKRHVLSYLK